MKHRTVLTIVFFIILTLFFFRAIFSQPGMIGRTWDWGMPATYPQYQKILSAQLYAWDNRIYGGLKSTFKNELPYWLLLYPLAHLGGPFLSKSVPFFLIILAAISMFLLLLKKFNVSCMAAITAAILYAYSPFAYSRIIAGHMTMLLGYALLPALLGLSMSFFSDKSRIRTQVLGMYSMLLLVATLVSTQLNIVIIGFVVVGIGWLYEWIEAGSRMMNLIKKGIFFVIGFGFMNAFWILPVLTSYISERGVYLRPTETVNQEAVRRADYISTQSQSLVKLITNTIPFGLNTEYVYPAVDGGKEILSAVFLVLFITLISSGVLLWKRKVFTFYVFFLVSIFLSTGDTLLPGKIFYEAVFRFVPSLFAGFSNPLRFLPFIYLSGAIVFAVVCTHIENTWKTRNNTFRILVVIFFITLLQPWVFSLFTVPVIGNSSQPLSLVIAPVHADDLKFEKWLELQPEDTRFVSLPPAFLSWPGKTAHILPWTTGYYPKPVMLQYLDEPLANIIYPYLYTNSESTHLMRVFGLGNISTVIYPNYESFESYFSFRPNIRNYKSIFDANLNKQSDLTPINITSTDTRIWNNDAVLPKIYVPEQITAVNTVSAIVEAVSLPEYVPRNAMVQLDQGADLMPGRIVIKPEEILIPRETNELKSLLSPQVLLLPTSRFYWLSTLNDPSLKLVNSSHDLDIFLKHASKKHIEVLRIIGTQYNPNEVLRNTINEYIRIINVIQEYVNGKHTIEENEAYKILYIMQNHYTELQGLYAKYQLESINNEIQSAMEIHRLIFSKVKDYVRNSTDSELFKYSFTNPTAGEYELMFPASDMVPESITLNDTTVQINHPSRVSEWVSYGPIPVPQGNVLMKVVFKPQPNLWTGELGVPVTDLSIGNQPIDVIQGQPSYTKFQKKISGLERNSKYRFSFMYKNLGSTMHISLSPESEEVRGSESAVYYESVLPATQTWRMSYQEFYSDISTTSAIFTLNINPSEYQTDYYQLKDINFTRIPEITPVFRKYEPQNNVQTPEISFHRVNPTKYIVSVSDASQPFLLVFNESYHVGWQPTVRKQNTVKKPPVIAKYFNNQVTELASADTYIDMSAFGWQGNRTVNASNHLLVNGYANSWLINETGSYEIVVQFYPQRWMYLGLVITGISWVFFGLLGLIWFMRRAYA